MIKGQALPKNLRCMNLKGIFQNAVPMRCLFSADVRKPFA